MTRIEILLEHLTEECAEVIQRITKAQRFGLKEKQKDQDLTNEQRIKYELDDLRTVIKFLIDEGLEIEPEYSFKKAEKIRKYLELSRKEGRLQE